MLYEEVLPDFFMINVPLPNSPLRGLNAYLVRGASRHLLIDNGFNTEESAGPLFAALAELKIDLGDTDFFLTHLHSDHVGLTADLLTSPSSKVMCSKTDGDRINRMLTDKEYWRTLIFGLQQHGFSESELEQLMTSHPGKAHGPSRPLPITPVQDGDRLEYGKYQFSVLEVPGHTPGQVTLYESNTRTYVSGDHILGTITPNITKWDGVQDSLGDYLRSLDKVSQYPIGLILPGHRDIIHDAAGRIKALRRHHDARLNEVCSILDGAGPLNAYDTASLMQWSLRGIVWENFPVAQKCFATGEALAHLTHLAETGRAHKAEWDDGCYFFLPQSSHRDAETGSDPALSNKM